MPISFELNLKTSSDIRQVDLFFQNSKGIKRFFLTSFNFRTLSFFFLKMFSFCILCPEKFFFMQKKIKICPHVHIYLCAQSTIVRASIGRRAASNKSFTGC